MMAGMKFSKAAITAASKKPDPNSASFGDVKAIGRVVATGEGPMNRKQSGLLAAASPGQANWKGSMGEGWVVGPKNLAPSGFGGVDNATYAKRLVGPKPQKSRGVYKTG